MSVKVKSLAWILRNQAPTFNHDNLHRIAISNLNDSRRRQERWWAKKYGPLKQYDEHTDEEIWIEMLEDFYEAHPVEIQRFLDSEHVRKVGEWDGRVSNDHEKAMKAYWDKKKKIDISAFQSDENLTPEQEAKILADLGMNLPKSKRVIHGSPIKGKQHEIHTLGEEFDEDFEGE